jgi:hypothetical protein
MFFIYYHLIISRNISYITISEGDQS